MVQQTKRGRQPLLWGLPGGHGEEGENPDQTTIREVKEETNLDIKLTNFVNVDILKVYDGSEYLLVTYKAEAKNLRDIKIDKNEVNDYSWFSFEDIKSRKVKLRGNFLIAPALKSFSKNLADVDSLTVSHYMKAEKESC